MSDSGNETCTWCDGTGKVPATGTLGGNSEGGMRDCPNCKGTGTVKEKTHGSW